MPHDVYQDETHKNPIAGGKGHNVRGSRTQCRFPRNEYGQVDPNGTLAPRSYQKKFKYTHQSRFALGCAVIEKNGVVEGVNLPPFNYSKRKILGIPAFNLARQAEVMRVQKLPTGGGQWITGKRKPGELYWDDSLTEVKGIKEATASKFHEAGINTVGELIDAHNADPSAYILEGISQKGFAKYFEACGDAQIGAFEASSVVDHRRAENPYSSLYGSVEGEKKLRESGGMKKLMCVTEMVDWMMTKTHAEYSGTDQAESWMIYHDALSIMCAESCQTWMKSQPIGTRSYYDCWILPEAGLCEGTMYASRPPGNSPEMMVGHSLLDPLTLIPYNVVCCQHTI